MVAVCAKAPIGSGVYRGADAVLVAIDDMAGALTGDREHFWTPGTRRAAARSARDARSAGPRGGRGARGGSRRPRARRRVPPSGAPGRGRRGREPAGVLREPARREAGGLRERAADVLLPGLDPLDAQIPAHLVDQRLVGLALDVEPQERAGRRPPARRL
jgi:hypothetical protein